MSSGKQSIPFLPGNTFQDVKVIDKKRSAINTHQKHDFRKPHSLGYKNGYPIQITPKLGIGLEELETTVPTPQELLAAAGNNPSITYGDKQFHTPIKAPRFVPAHVAFDKVVLRFDAYFKETVHESTEQYHLRKVHIHYFLEDDSIAVVEPPVENSGIPQGVLIKRHRIPRSTTEFYSIKDFNLGININFYGKTFRIVDCDQFTAV